jgi:hypothetical protein
MNNTLSIKSSSPPRMRNSLHTWIVMGLLLCCGSASAAVGKLATLSVSGLSPAFDPNVKAYTIPKTASCSAKVVASLAQFDAQTQFYIANTPVSGGSGTINAWYCNASGKIEIIIYENWAEKGRYTITPVEQAPPPPPVPPVSGKLTGLLAANLSPAFDPNVKQYTVPMPANCSVPVKATVADPANPNLKLYISSNPTTSGTVVNAWVCGNQPKVEIVIYDVWTEVGHYSITPVGEPVATPPPTPTPTPTPVVVDPPTEQIPTTTPSPLPLPAASPVDKLSAGRFLSQASFGPTPQDLAALQPVGLQYWMAQQYNLPATTLGDGLSTNQVINQTLHNMANAPDQLRQRMVFALSQIFVVSANKNVNGEELIPWVNLLNRNAFGNFRQLLKEVTFSPTMGKFLDLANSKKATASTSPNENYAREVMQLFTIGLKQLNQDGSVKLDGQGQPIPTYDQATLREVARALTGLTYPTAPGKTPQSNNWEWFTGLMEYRQANHDTGAKTIVNGVSLPAGQTVKQDFDAVIDTLVSHPNTAPFIATRLIRSLVSSNPSGAYIQRVADKFVDNGLGVRGDLWAVLTAVLTDPEATAAPSAQRGHLKDPVLHVLNLGRALGASINDPSIFMYDLRLLGEQVLTPNSVFSFYSPLAALPGYPGLFGPEFQIYPPGLAIQRGNLIWKIINGQLGSSFTVNLSQFTSLANNPAALVEQVNQVLLLGTMSNTLRSTLTGLASHPYTSLQDRVLITLYFTAISSEYAVQP